MTINELLNDRKVIIEKALEDSFEFDDSPVAKAARYSLLSGGKRIRPIILLEFYKLCGGNDNSAINFAAAIEMIHTYSLIHDDLPCMDNDDFRRGRPSCHKKFGEEYALLAGDALLTHAFYTASMTQNIPPELVLKAISVLSQKSGIIGMVGGQSSDLILEKRVATAPELIDMYLKKTGCLLEASAVIGCILAGADSSKAEYASLYAKNVGLAFQIIDDILDCTSDQSVLGKPVGSDEKNGKNTYVSIFGIEASRTKAAELSDKALKILDKFSGDTSSLKSITNYLLDRKY